MNTQPPQNPWDSQPPHNGPANQHSSAPDHSQPTATGAPNHQPYSAPSYQAPSAPSANSDAPGQQFGHQFTPASGSYASQQNPPKKKSPLPWILGGCGCLTLLAIAAIVALFAFGGLLGPGDPEKPVATMLEALKDGDCEKAKSVVQESARKNAKCDSFEQASKLINDQGEFSYDIKESKVNGDEATVQVHVALKTDGGTTHEDDVTISLLEEDGEWRIKDLDQAMN